MNTSFAIHSIKLFHFGKFVILFRIVAISLTKNIAVSLFSFICNYYKEKVIIEREENCDFKCKNNQCITEEKICNNEINCIDKSDEICRNDEAISEKFKTRKFFNFFSS